MDRSTWLWLALVAATLMSWLIGHGAVGGTGGGAMAVIVIAMVKVRLVGLDFMELRHAPRAMRIAFEGWVVGVGLVLIAFYLG